MISKNPLAPLVLFTIFMQRLWWIFLTIRQGKQTKELVLIISVI
jgi:hypothetical protein